MHIIELHVIYANNDVTVTKQFLAQIEEAELSYVLFGALQFKAWKSVWGQFVFYQSNVCYTVRY